MDAPFNLKSSLTYQIAKMQQIPGTRALLVSQLGEMAQERQQAVSDLAGIDMSRKFFAAALETIYAESVGELEKVANMALSFVFHDKNLRLKMALEDYRGNKTLDLSIVDLSHTPPLEVDIKDGTGAGIRTVVSFVVHFYYILNKGAAPYIFVDEKYAAVSAQYRDRFIQFVRQLCQSKGGGVVLITHDPEYCDIGDVRYIISDGKVRKEEAGTPPSE